MDRFYKKSNKYILKVGKDSRIEEREVLNNNYIKISTPNKEVDMVNNPPHYKGLPKGLEVIDLTENMDFCLGNTIKYIFRAGKKDPSKEIEDLEKAQYYLSRKIKILKEKKEHNSPLKSLKTPKKKE